MDENQTQDHRIKNVDLTSMMRSSFLDYAMSVIVARALPDVRDGLKPVQRRILYGMSELGVTPDKPYRRVPELLGKLWVSFTPMVIPQSILLWHTWHKISHTVTC